MTAERVQKTANDLKWLSQGDCVLFLMCVSAALSLPGLLALLVLWPAFSAITQSVMAGWVLSEPALMGWEKKRLVKIAQTIKKFSPSYWLIRIFWAAYCWNAERQSPLGRELRNLRKTLQLYQRQNQSEASIEGCERTILELERQVYPILRSRNHEALVACCTEHKQLETGSPCGG